MDICSYRFVDEIKSLPFVEAVYLYGSRARGDNVERSDIDIAVECKSGTAHEAWHKVMEIVENADTLLQIDCIRLDTLTDDDRIKKYIVKDMVEL